MPYNYIVNAGTNPNGPFPISGGTVSNPTDTISGLSPNTNYWFQIIPVDTASNLQGPTTVVGPISTPLNPTAPTNFTVTGVTQTAATLSWTASSV